MPRRPGHLHQPFCQSALPRETRGHRRQSGLSLMFILPLMSLAVAGPALADPGKALSERGLALSKIHCARCHIVHEGDRFTGTSSTPSFKAMIAFLKDWEERFGSFMARNPHPAHIRLQGDSERPEHLPATIREVILTLDDIEAILAYVDQMALDLGKKAPD
ncbi:hypothetical protein [Roseibium sp.]|uniref:hypothetical protein n=1 Tax=Roseibium sp. TaxID=1936156 RepID=UPI003A986EFA